MGTPELTVEVHSATDAALARRVQKEDLNKTTIVNRAVQFYDQLQDIIERGGKVMVQQPGSEEFEMMRVE